MSPKRNSPLRLIALCYLAGLLVWLGVCCAGLAGMALARADGSGETRRLERTEFEYQSVKDVDSLDYPAGLWVVSTDADPQLIWEGEAYLDRVTLYLVHEKPGNGVELYYRSPGEIEFDLRKVVFAKRDDEGYFVFDLGGKKVNGLRFDIDSVGGVVSSFDGAQLNTPRPLAGRFVPSGGALLLLFTLPMAAAALVQGGLTLAAKPEKPKEETEA